MPSPHRLVAGLLAAAALLALAMALTEGINQRPDLWRGPPDEYGHRAAARYYVDHWLPPKVGDPASLDSYSRDYGLSYLNDPDPVYFLAGKFAVLASPIVSDPHRAFRLFNVALLAALAVLAWRRPGAWPVFVPLLVSPQVWYIFSYFNNDAFPLFLSIVAAWQLADRESLFNRFLDGHGPRHLAGLVLMVVLLGLLLTSKLNYFAFLALAAAIIALTRLGLESSVLIAIAGVLGAAAFQRWIVVPTLTLGWLASIATTAVLAVMFVRPGTRALRLHTLGRLGLAGVLAAALMVPRYYWDSVQHGSLEQKIHAQTALQQQIAKPEYKPKTINTREGAFYGIELRNRGTPLATLFKEPWNWHVKTFLTATGAYGWLEFHAGTAYRALLLLGYLALFGAYAWTAVRARDARAAVSFVQVTGFAALIVWISLFHSWNNDFQAQGRYLFPIIPMLGLGLLLLRDRLPAKAVLATTAFCFALSAYSFAFIGLAQVPRTFAP